MILVASFKANIKHIGEKTIQSMAKSTQLLSKKKRKNFSSTTVWEREGWDMINENRRETTQVGGVWGEKPPQYEERYDPSWWSERGLWNESSAWRLVYPP